jgi:hypothetical protein
MMVAHGTLKVRLMSTYSLQCSTITIVRISPTIALTFETVANEDTITTDISYEQDHHEPLMNYFAVLLDSTIQDIGSVLTRPGHVLFFSDCIPAPC